VARTMEVPRAMLPTLQTPGIEAESTAATVTLAHPAVQEGNSSGGADGRGRAHAAAAPPDQGLHQVMHEAGLATILFKQSAVSRHASSPTFRRTRMASLGDRPATSRGLKKGMAREVTNCSFNILQ
jgi:hypothetical protein